MVMAQKQITRTGYISFTSDTPTLVIKGENNQVLSIIDIETGDIVFAVLMKAFVFEQALAEEHFNENYVESDTYPKAKFSGNIKNWKNIDLSKDTTYQVTVSGKMTIHGVTNNINQIGTLTIKNGLITAYADFLIPVADYNINIPKLVADKVAKNAHVIINMKYEPY